VPKILFSVFNSSGVNSSSEGFVVHRGRPR